MNKNNKNFLNNFKIKCISGVLTVCIATTVLISSPEQIAYANDSNSINIYINGQLLNSDESAFISNGRTFIPLRDVIETLGANVSWDEVNRTVTVTKDTSNIKLYIDNRLFSYVENGITKYDVSDVAPLIKNNHTYVPLRLVGNALGLNVSWNDTTKEVSVKDSSNPSITNFFDIKIADIENGQVLTDITRLSLIGAETLPKNATQIKYLFINPTTGEGKIVARSTSISKATTFIPNIDIQGNGILAAVVCDAKGNFLAGTCVNTSVKVNSNVSISGLTSGQSINKTVPLSANLNFRPTAIKYEFTYQDGSVYTTDELDPYGTYNYTPSIRRNGTLSVRVLAIDKNEKVYTSDYTNATIAMVSVPSNPYVALKKIKTSNVGKIPVNLSISRNFDVDTTQYYAQNVDTGKTILLKEVGWGDYQWFPGPDMAGNWEIYVRVVNSKNKKAYYSNSIKVAVPNTTSIILSGIGPDQVITGTMTMNAICNVNIEDVSYVISNPYNYTEKVMGTETSVSTKVSYTPNYINEGKRYIQAIAKTTDGKVIKSEKVAINIYLGELYGSKPITVKTNFINYVTPMALKTQKENGMSAALQVAQAILETGWGQSVPVDKYTGLLSNNLFGVKGTGNAGSVLCSTWEEYYGTVYRIDDHFRAYKSTQDSWNDHNNLLLRASRYIPYTEVMFDSTSGAYALRRCGYATDSGYPGKLIWLIERYNLDKLDNQKI
ncbi:glucosaminidase domain-containing protein [Sedimentibacter sp. zth1]|uniref:stalk domain-containing protein n=1 Tax=Sedimentibacter sp. zth1 TaxID=2816908 RepID=UPI001A911341|nr:stalk domain-containing protein [Sedimentibacter sp. zth1]QSX04853.1 glucosaminidase domain-containing protein [Sedimentibacter sp. zth1]